MAYILEVIVKKEVPLISALIVGFIHASVMEETDIAYFISNLFSTSFFYSTFMNYKYHTSYTFYFSALEPGELYTHVSILFFICGFQMTEEAADKV